MKLKVLCKFREITGKNFSQPPYITPAITPLSLPEYRARRSLTTVNEMNRVMLAYLVCPQRWLSTIGNQNDCPLKKIYFEAFNFLLMQNNLNFILQNFRAGVWATQKSKKKLQKNHPPTLRCSLKYQILGNCLFSLFLLLSIAC